MLRLTASPIADSDQGIGLGSRAVIRSLPLDARWTREGEKRWKTPITPSGPKGATEQARRAQREILKNDENTLRANS